MGYKVHRHVFGKKHKRWPVNADRNDATSSKHIYLRRIAAAALNETLFCQASFCSDVFPIFLQLNSTRSNQNEDILIVTFPKNMARPSKK